jgi:hypothetical protein
MKITCSILFFKRLEIEMHRFQNYESSPMIDCLKGYEKVTTYCRSSYPNELRYLGADFNQKKKGYQRPILEILYIFI